MATLTDRLASIAVQRLDEGWRVPLVSHFLSLPPGDRSLRFGIALAPSFIASYVERINFARDTVFGVHDDNLALVGVAHVAIEGHSAELGLSVLPEHRRRGVGRALFERAVAHARNRRVLRFCVDFLSANAPILRMVQKFGMKIVSLGIEAHAELELPEPSAASVAEERVADTLARCDRAWKALIARWARRRVTGGNP
ncbi:MAG TPA: GNAT family N-acetyltransferase [Casimicrobiaceae bacterium]|nr:GNAT family N-acetyltransferase [Casimicrobiaceae bacterium]